MHKRNGLFDPELMLRFPSGTAARTFSEWAANHVGLEQVIGLAGFLSPGFFEFQGCVFWDEYVVEKLETRGIASSPFGNDDPTIERYYNVVNLAEFFIASADAAVDQESLLVAFGRVLEAFWGNALRSQFPDRVFQFETARDLFDESGLCFTFWTQR
jgi:hypothetical protein